MSWLSKITFCLVWLLASSLGTRSAGFLIDVEAMAGTAGHPVSIVEANIFVQKNRIVMNLKCFADDLELIQGLEPLADGSYDKDEMAVASREHAKFLAERIDILDANGEKLKAKIIESLAPELPEGGIKQGDLMSLFCSFRFEYSYDSPPEFITINQRMMGEGYLQPSELQIVIKQAGSDTPYTHMMKPEMPETFRFDWNNPILNEDASPDEWESWFEEQRKATLGITSYSSVYSFLYITNHEVRHEILIPLASLATMIDFQRADPSFLEIPEQDAAKQQIIDFFSIGSEIEIDSVPVKPVFDRIDFYGLDLRDFAVQAERRRISMASGRIGVIMSYSAKSPPTEVKVNWTLFNDAVQTVDSAIIAYDQVSQTQFSRFLEDNTYIWSSPERPPLPQINEVDAVLKLQTKPTLLPLASLILGSLGVLAVIVAASRRSAIYGLLAVGLGVGAFFAREQILTPIGSTSSQIQIAEADAKSVFGRLHENVFRAFDYHQEADVYDALENSVNGKLLRDLYLQIHERLVMQDQGGAAARIDEVQLLDGSLIPVEGPKEFPGFAYRATWNLLGTVEHWGHLHQRTNQYEAQFYVSLIDGAWKITEMEALDEKQIAVNTSPRKFGG